MSFAWKVGVTVVLFAICAVAAVILIVSLLGTPPVVDYSAGASGQPVNVTLQSVGSIGSGNHPDWVSYLVETPQGQWVHTTVFQVPQHTRINFTIYNYDSGSPLRNQQLGQVTGTYGNVALLNGHPFRVINSNAGNGVAHTFTIPELGVSVPLYANNGNANLCGAAPCTTSSRTRSSGSPSPAPARATIAGSASSPAGSAGSSATVARWGRWATWAGS